MASRKEYGIQSPDGKTHWGNFIGRSLETEQDRAVLSLVLHKTAQELGFPDDEFMDRFCWVSRTINDDDRHYTIDHPQIAPPLPQPGQPAPEQVAAKPTPVKATPKRSPRRKQASWE